MFRPEFSHKQGIKLQLLGDDLSRPYQMSCLLSPAEMSPYKMEMVIYYVLFLCVGHLWATCH